MSRAAGDGSPVRVITVPRFSTTGTAVLVNLRTLESKPIVFGAGAEDWSDDEDEDVNPADEEEEDVEMGA